MMMSQFLFETPNWDHDDVEDNIVNETFGKSLFSSSSNQKSNEKSNEKSKKKKKKKKFEFLKSEDGDDLRKNLLSETEDSVFKSPSRETSRDNQSGKNKNRKEKLTRKISESVVKQLSSTSSSSTTKGNLLRQGIKFSNAQEFEAYITQEINSNKRKKRKLSQDDKTLETNSENNVISARKKLKKDKESTSSSSIASSSKFDVSKIRELLSSTSSSSISSNKSTATSDESKAHKTLKQSRFRYLNEKLYTQSGAQSLKMFKQDAESFKIYHEGFMDQARKWPVDPLNLIISAILKRSDTPVVADFGCGEARLARAVSSAVSMVYSFDFVKLNDYVTVCDFSKVPLPDDSVDIVVFCLSMMGTNLKDYLREANRILKNNGTVKIAEVESRFTEDKLTVHEFIRVVEKMGFKLKWKDLSNQYFYLMDFKKIGPSKKKVPDFALKPCIYKKR